MADLEITGIFDASGIIDPVEASAQAIQEAAAQMIYARCDLSEESVRKYLRKVFRRYVGGRMGPQRVGHEVDSK